MNISTNITGTVYLIWLNSSGQFYNGSTFENYSAGNYSTYDVAVTASGGRVTATPPTDASDYQLRLQAGGSPATTDAIVDAGSTYLDSPVSEGGGQGSSVTVYTAASYAGSTPLNDSEPITLYRGCADTIDPPSLEGYAGGIENGDEVVLRIVAKDVYEDISEDDDVPALVEATTTASLVDGTLTLSWDLTAEQTGALPAGADGSGRTVYKVIAGKDGERPVLDRDCVVFRFPAAPV